MKSKHYGQLLSCLSGAVILSALVWTLDGCSPQSELKPASALEQKKVSELANAARNVSEIFGEMCQYPETFDAIREAIAQEYYSDERMPLKDILHPESSPAFQQIKDELVKRQAAETNARFTAILRGCLGLCFTNFS